MLPERAVVVADAHLGPESEQRVADSFAAFLETVPRMGRHLVIAGDLFEFWFEYRHVIPRDAFPTLAALAALRKAGVQLSVVGGNHDRWGRDFWSRELGAAFSPGDLTVPLSGWNCLICHGDGRVEQHGGAKVLHAITRNRLAVAAFRWLHPDLAFSLVRGGSRWIGDSTRDPAILQRAASAQRELARSFLDERPDVDIVVMAHTHRPALEPAGEKRWYLNPGAWLDGGRYAVISPEGPRLCRFEP